MKLVFLVLLKFIGPGVLYQLQRHHLNPDNNGNKMQGRKYHRGNWGVAQKPQAQEGPK